MTNTMMPKEKYYYSYLGKVLMGVTLDSKLQWGAHIIVDFGR